MAPCVRTSTVSQTDFPAGTWPRPGARPRVRQPPPGGPGTTRRGHAHPADARPAGGRAALLHDGVRAPRDGRGVRDGCRDDARHERVGCSHGAGEGVVRTRAVVERHFAHEENELEPQLQPFLETPEWKAVEKKLGKQPPSVAGPFFAWLTDGMSEPTGSTCAAWSRPRWSRSSPRCSAAATPGHRAGVAITSRPPDDTAVRCRPRAAEPLSHAARDPSGPTRRTCHGRLT